MSWFVMYIGRIGEVKRVTKETNVFVKVNLDGTGVAENSSGIPFLDHMLDVSLLSVYKYMSFLHGRSQVFTSQMEILSIGEI